VARRALRPAVEDQWGAGALISALADGGWTDIAPEARAAAAAFEAVADGIADALHRCAGGRELDEIGYADDIDTAAQLDAAEVVPVLHGPAFVPAGPDGDTVDVRHGLSAGGART